MVAEEEALYKENEAYAELSAGSPNSSTVQVTLNKEPLRVKKGTASRFLHLYAIKTLKCTASNFENYGQYAGFGANVTALTQADLTRVSGDPWNSSWNVASTKAIKKTIPAQGAYIVNLTTASGNVFNDIKLTALAGADNAHMHRQGYDVDMFEDNEANGVIEHTITVDIFLEIDSIDNVNNTITLKSPPPDEALGKFEFCITSPMEAGQAAKHPNSGVRFNPGTKKQEALATLEGIGTSSVALSISNAALEKFNGSNYTLVTATGAQAAQIDEVKLIIQYPSGMYLQVDRSGSLYTAGVAYHIELKVDNGLTQGYRTCLLYTSPSPRDKRQSRMPSSA